MELVSEWGVRIRMEQAGDRAEAVVTMSPKQLHGNLIRLTLGLVGAAGATGAVGGPWGPWGPWAFLCSLCFLSV